MKVLAIIPARGGSQGVPGKNVLDIDGLPLIGYAIKTAAESEKITKTIVSTDSKEIADVCKTLGAEVHLRDAALATATSNVLDTVKAVLLDQKNIDVHFDAIVLLQPTAPLRTGMDVDKAIDLLIREKVDGVISTIKVEDNHPARMYRVKSDKMISFDAVNETTRRQDLEPLFLRNGCIYIVTQKAIEQENTLMPANKCAYKMDARWAVNIDTPIDVIILQYLIKEWKATHK